MTIIKTISIKPEHQEWMDKNTDFEFSKFVQSKLDELIIATKPLPIIEDGIREKQKNLLEQAEQEKITEEDRIKKMRK